MVPAFHDVRRALSWEEKLSIIEVVPFGMTDVPTQVHLRMMGRGIDCLQAKEGERRKGTAQRILKNFRMRAVLVEHPDSSPKDEVLQK